MLFDLRGRGRRRTVKIVYITLALLMGGGLVLFGIGGGGAMQGGLVDAITGSSGGDTGTARFDQREREAAAQDAHQPAGRGRLGRARPRPRAERRHRRQLRPEHGDLHGGGQGQARRGRRRVGEVPRARSAQARRPRGEPDGARVRPDRPQPPDRTPPRRRRSSPRRARRRPPTRRWRSTPTRPARPARATSRATRRSSAPRRTSRTRSRARSTRPSSRRSPSRSSSSRARPRPTATPKKEK